MKLLILIGISSFYIANARAENPANIYLVWRSSFTQTHIDVASAMKVQGHFQPIRNFGLNPLPNTNYWLMTVTTNTNIQNTALKAMESQGRVKRIRAIWGVDGVYDGSVGGMVIKPRKEQFSQIPEEAHTKWEDTWEVKISCP